MQKQKFQLGQEVKVEFRGVVYRLENTRGFLTYDVRSKDGESGIYLLESSIISQDEEIGRAKEGEENVGERKE